jgi:hypothetical protein
LNPGGILQVNNISNLGELENEKQKNDDVGKSAQVFKSLSFKEEEGEGAGIFI